MRLPSASLGQVEAWGTKSSPLLWARLQLATCAVTGEIAYSSVILIGLPDA
jgi:hypothetical protein